jgi:hypothetical protein
VEVQLVTSQQQLAHLEVKAGEQERSLNEQLRAALAQAKLYEELATNEQQKREQVMWCCEERPLIGLS